MNAWKVGGLVIVMGSLFYAAAQKDAAHRERIQRFNAEAARDSSRVLLRDSTHTLTERLAFQSTQTLNLSHDMERLLRRDGSRIEMLARLRVELDSVHGAVTSGIVTGDSALRYLGKPSRYSGFSRRYPRDGPSTTGKRDRSVGYLP